MTTVEGKKIDKINLEEIIELSLGQLLYTNTNYIETPLFLV